MRLLKPIILLLLLAGFVLPSVFAAEQDLLEARAKAAYADRHYAHGIALFGELVARHGDDPRADYWAMMRVRGTFLAGKHEEAAAAGEEFLGTFRESRYFDKVAFTTARAMLLTGRGAEGAELMAASVKRLSGPELRTAIAEVYLSAADTAYAGIASSGPFDEGTPPDYARAQKLYGLARASGIPDEKVGEVLLRYARAALQNRGYDLVIEVLDERERNPKLAADPDALLLRGRALLGRKRVPAARDVLLRIVGEAPGTPQAAMALFLLDDPASLERLVREYPRHPRAVEGSFRRGELLRKQGHVDRAVQVWLDTAHVYPETTFAPRAVKAAADLLFAAGRFDQARTRYDEFLRRFPESPDWAIARDQLTEAWYRVGLGLAKRENADRASEVWQGLRMKYPLSKQASRSLLAESRARGFDPKALGILRELLARYPKSPEAPEGALLIAGLHERMSGNTAEAVAAYRQVTVLYPGSSAARRAESHLREMQEESLHLKLPGVLAPGAPAQLEIRTRNLKRVTGRIYRIDPAAYFRKHGDLAGIENVMVEVMAPDAVFDHVVPGYRKFRSIEGKLTVPVEGEGAYIVVVEGGKLTATCLLLVSDLTVIAKESPGGVLAFVQNRTGGEPVKDAEVLVRTPNGTVRSERSGADGVARLAFPSVGAGIVAVRGDSVALAGFDSRKRTVRGIATTVHIATDRPVYRPGHEVRFRAVVRQAAGEFFKTPAGVKVLIKVADRAGNPLYRQELVLSEFGTAAGAFRLPADIPPHTYTIKLRFGEQEFSRDFTVEAYRKPQIFLTITPKRPVYIRGETVEMEIKARYAFGRPMAGLELSLDVSAVGIEGWHGRKLKLTTDASGIALQTVPTRPGVDAKLRFMATARDVTRRLYFAEAMVPVMNTGYQATLSMEREGYFSGETARVKLLTADILGNPVAAKGKIEVGYRSIGRRPALFSVVETLPIETDAGGKSRLTYDLAKPGHYRFTFRGADRTGREVRAEVQFDAESASDRLIVRIDRPEHFVGDRMTVKLTAPAANRYALLTIEGEELYSYRVVRLTARESTFEFGVDRRQVPEVWVAAALIDDGRLYRGIDQVTVVERIRLTVTPEREEYQPGELCRLTIVTKDDAGNPLPAEVAIGVVDEGLYLVRADDTPDLVATFRPGARQHLVRTTASTGFEFVGRTSSLSEDLLAERARRLEEPTSVPAVILEEKSLEKVDDAFDGPLDNSSTGIGGGAGGSFGGRGGQRNLRAMGGGRIANAESLFPARTQFEDTAFFKADVVTGPDGTAIVEFTLPDDLTEWRITARGASHGNAFGSARSSFLTDRPLVIRAALPRYLREGDRLTGGAGVVNGMDEETEITVTLSPAATEAGITQDVVVLAGAERLVDWPLPTGVLGELTFFARATTRGIAEDAEERKLAVLPFGVPWRDGYGATGTDPAMRTLVIPEDAVPGTVKVVVLAPENLAEDLLAGIGELRRFPYGCTEQTVNRFYPAIEVAQAFRKVGMDRSGALAHLDRMVKAGALRLTYLQNKQGLWGWWQKGESNPEMTAYALIGLAAARDSGVELSAEVFKRAEKGLPALIRRTSSPDERAFLRLAQSRAFGANYETLASSFADRARLSLKGLAFLALAYEPLGPTAQHSLLRKEVIAKASRESDTESLGFALAAVAVPEESAEGIRHIEALLGERRIGSGFGTTRETGAVVAGMARVAAFIPFAGPSPDREASVRLHVNGKTADLPRSSSMVVPAALLVPGKNRIRVSSLGSHSVVLSCVRRTAPDAVGPLSLSRQLALVPISGGTRDFAMLKKGAAIREPVVDAVRIGEAVRVTLTVRTGGERYLVIEDPIPAGFETVPGTAKGPIQESTRYDDKMVFFLENPKPEVTISYLILGEAPGAVRIPPAVTYAMYRPNAAAYSGVAALTIADFEEPLTRDKTLAYSAADLWSEALRAERAGERETAKKLIATLLERFELNEEYLTLSLRALARINAAVGHDASAIEAYERLLAEVPSFRTDIRDEQLLAKAFAALKRYGEAMGSLERIAWRLFIIDGQVPREIGGAKALEIEADLLDRYPAAEYTERVFLRRADRAALAFEEQLRRTGAADDALLEPLTEFLTRYPESPDAERVFFRHARTRLRAGKFTELEALSRRFGDRYPDSNLCDDADWFTAFALFAEGRHNEAEQFALASLAKEYRQEDGTLGTSEYRKNLVHLIAQVAHIEGRLDEAIALYEQVKDQSVDAREALKQLTEVTFSQPAVVRAEPGETISFPVTSKNLAVIDYRVYPIDLLVYFALKKDVDEVAGLNLDGLPPRLKGALTRSVESLRREDVRTVDLGELDPGVYLVILEGGGRERRTLIIVSDLSAEIRRHSQGVRILVTNRRTGRPVSGAFVKLARNGRLLKEGRTDPRGIFEVRGAIAGKLSAVVEKDGSYALGKQ